MGGSFDRIRIRIRHPFPSPRLGGPGVRSTPERDLIRSAVRGKDVPGLERIEVLRRQLLQNPKLLHVPDHGAGSRHRTGEKRSVRQLVRTTAVPASKGRLLARIASFFGFPVVIELGTGTGISSLYLGMACPRSQVLSCEGSPALARLAASNIAEMGLPNIEVSNALFGDWLPGVLDRVQGDVLVFIDGDHREESLQRYCSLILASGLGKIVLVLDDIRWSPEMYRAWKRLSAPGTSGRGFEFHNTGILLSGFDF